MQRYSGVDDDPINPILARNASQGGGGIHLMYYVR